MLVNIFFLSIVDAHERLDQFNYTLRIPDQVPIDFNGREAFGEPSKEPRQVDDLPVGSAHRLESVTIEKEFADLRVDSAFILAFVLDDLPLD